MTPARFRRLAAVYGGRIDRWPAAERTEARTVLERDGEARQMLEEEAQLDRHIPEFAPVVGPDAVERVLVGLAARLDGLDLLPARRFQPPAPTLQPRFAAQAAAFLTVMVVAGFLLGQTGVVPDRARPAPDMGSLALPTTFLLGWDR